MRLDTGQTAMGSMQIPYAMMSGARVNGLAPVGNTLTEYTLHGEAKRIAASFDVPYGLSLHHCSSVETIRGWLMFDG